MSSHDPKPDTLQHRGRRTEALPRFRIRKLESSSHPGYLLNVSSKLPSPGHLWTQGEILADDARAVAIVGGRWPFKHCAKHATDIATDLVREKVCIVSGLAFGIDAIAHRAALKAGGRTLAVLGTGFEHIRPSSHEKLYAEILKSGAGLSLFGPNFSGFRDGRNYLQRNALIAALSKVMVVAYAKGERSGTMAAARCALRAGIPVGLSASMALCQDWAKAFLENPGTFIVHSAADVLERMGS